LLVKRFYIFDSAAQASKKLGIGRPNIVAVLNGRRDIAGGYIWMYTKEGMIHSNKRNK
jgi:hypothetical protein